MKKNTELKIIIVAFCVFFLVSCIRMDFFIPQRQSEHSNNSRVKVGEGIKFTYYTGPVFAMTAMEENSLISVNRNLDYDFSLYSNEDNNECLIKDTYSLTNNSEKDQTVKLLYPFVNRIADYNDQLPDIDINGAPVSVVSSDAENDAVTKNNMEAKLYFGPDYYTMSRLLPDNSLHFQENDDTLCSYMDFKTLMESGYQNKSLETASEINQSIKQTATTFLEEYRKEISWGGQRMLTLLSPDMLARLAEEIYDSRESFNDYEGNSADTCLDDVFRKVIWSQRISYLSFEVEIPVGESVQIVAEYKKEASTNEDGRGDSKDLKGYSMLPTIGSNLNFLWQTASVSKLSYVEIVNQNFGFDVESGITEVDLDLEVEEYYMEILRLTENE